MAFFFFLLLLVGVFFNPATAAGDNSSSTPIPLEIENICNKTSSPSLCLSTLRPNLPIKNPTPLTILLLILQSARNQTSKAKTAFICLAQDPGMSQGDVAALKNCVMRYENSLDDYDAAVKYVNGKDWASTEIHLSAVSDWYEECGTGQDAPEDPKLGHGPWDVFGSWLMKLVDVCFDLVKYSRNEGEENRV